MVTRALTTRTALWLTLLACVLAAAVPAGGLTLCIDAQHVGVGHGETRGCPCDDHAPADDHHDLALDATDFGKPHDEAAPSPPPLVVMAVVPQLPRLVHATASPTARARPPTAAPEPPGLRIRRTAVLLI